MTTTGFGTEQRRGRAGPWAGIAFVVLFVAGFLIFATPNTNSHRASNIAKWDAWWTDSSHRTTAIIGAYLMVLGSLAFVWFASSLQHRLRDRSDGTMMIGFAWLFAAISLASALIRTAIPGGWVFGRLTIPGGDLPAQLDNIGQALLLLAGALSAGAFVASACHAARRSVVFPAWLATAGYVVAVLQIAGPFFFPFVLFPLWVLVASIVLLTRDAKFTAGSMAEGHPERKLLHRHTKVQHPTADL
ncbi:MAG TPA: hypothetical protein VHX59_16950 [Mycobacteriales bacterium]|jgi:hypothetical protein|nr:hypothetical protein [Mycobacteriales bacterium]